jgi:hypothetical protein
MWFMVFCERMTQRVERRCLAREELPTAQPYRSTTALGLFAIVCLLLPWFVGGWAIYTTANRSMFGIYLLFRYETGLAWEWRHVPGLQIFAYVCAVVVSAWGFSLWLWRAHANLGALGVRSVSFPSSWAPFSWLTGVSLFAMLQETWAKSDPGSAGDDFALEKRSPWITAWQGITLAFLAVLACAGLAFASKSDLLTPLLGLACLLHAIAIGLGWVVVNLIQHRQTARHATKPSPRSYRHYWNPFDIRAWFYGGEAERLKQSLGGMGVYSLFFVLFWFLISFNWWAGKLEYELPAGGGTESLPATPQVQVKKTKRLKYIVNPFAGIIFKVPEQPEEVLKEVLDQSANRYVAGQGGTPGQGKGQGAGFGAGTFKGKVRFIRLQHSDRFWNKDMGVGGDQNLLYQYGTRTGHKIGDRTESHTFQQLKSYTDPKKNPPLIYVCGKTTFQPTREEIAILRTYLVERHGMIFCDNRGGVQFGNQFDAAIRAALAEVPNVARRPVDRDHRIHNILYRLDRVPYVVAHDGTTPQGWFVDGRMVCYYHPGDIGDAWIDGNAAIPQQTAEACFQLGINILFYSHAEYSRWVTSPDEE